MAESIDNLIGQAFHDQPNLARRISDALAQTPQHSTIFADIANHVISLKLSISANTFDLNSRPSKRQRVHVNSGTADEHVVSNGVTYVPEPSKPSDSPPDFKESNVLLSVPDLSFTSPQRKKLTLDFTTNGLRGRTAGAGPPAFTVTWDDIKHAICVPVPEKAQHQYNFCLFPSYADGVSIPPNHPTATDAIVWTVPEGSSDAASGEWAQPGEGTYKSMLITSLGKLLKHHVKVVEPDEAEFASTLVQAHRKAEKALHVKAFRGSKDGYLFFLPTGILWAFKKPLLLFAFERIESISYTSVLQRTFNLNITTPAPTDPAAISAPEKTDTLEYEFSMIDQQDYPAIDAYVKRHSLQDASMAEQRRAKAVGLSEPKEEAPENGTTATIGENEEDDDEDEEGEDYDPGSEGESEGSGSDSSEGEEHEVGGEDEHGGDDDDDDDEGDEDLGSELQSL